MYWTRAVLKFLNTCTVLVSDRCLEMASRVAGRCSLLLPAAYAYKRVTFSTLPTSSYDTQALFTVYRANELRYRTWLTSGDLSFPLSLSFRPDTHKNVRGSFLVIRLITEWFRIQEKLPHQIAFTNLFCKKILGALCAVFINSCSI